MAYSIMIRDKKDRRIFRPYSIKQEIMVDVKVLIKDELTGEKNEVIEQRPSGKYKDVIYCVDSRDDMEKKYIELTNILPRSDLVPVFITDYVMDMVFTDSPINNDGYTPDIDGDGEPDVLVEATNEDIDDIF